MKQGWKLILFLASIVPAFGGLQCCGDEGYDVIVVGSGPAGLVVADRMSEIGKRTLLLEQGGPSYYTTGGRERPEWLSDTELSRVDVPGLYKSIFSEGGDLICSPQIVNSFQGCSIGGSTAINAGLFFQPPASDWDLYFPNGWKNIDMQSAIGKVRTKQPSTNIPSADGKQYLQSGYEAAKQWLVESAGFAEVDLNENPGNHSKKRVFGHPNFNYENGQRSGPAMTYLQSALERDNFALQTGARVLRVLRDGGIAKGVELESKNDYNETKELYVKDGGIVVLSAGALLSPQLLMWSGIGDPGVLANLSQNGHLHLPSSNWINNTAVGDKAFDNPLTFIELYSESISSYEHNYTNPVAQDRDLYLNSRSGPYSFASQTSAFWDFIQQGDNLVGCQGTIDSSGIGEFATNNGTITLAVYGTSGLRSFGKVELDQNGIAKPSEGFFYSDHRDAEAVGTFIYFILQVLPSSLRTLNVPSNSSKDEIVAWVSTKGDYTMANVQHWSSSCRFAACVDTNTKVLGMENLFVVDASISAPLTTNPVMGIMIVAERAVERILAIW